MTLPDPPAARLPWPTYFMDIAHLVAERSTCLRRRVGAVAVKNKRIIATGYNGAPTDVSHCLNVGCLRAALKIPSGERHEICRGLHAEQNIVVQAAVHALSLQGADIYCTHQPCFICTKLLINCEIKNVYYASPYPDRLASQMAEEAGMRFIALEYAPPALSRSLQPLGEHDL